jgi:hypothetical protein
METQKRSWFEQACRIIRAARRSLHLHEQPFNRCSITFGAGIGDAMNYAFVPYVGIGELRFDMSPAEVRRAIGMMPERASNRSPATMTRKEYYVGLGLLVEFDDRDRCSSVTIMHVGQLLFDEVNLMALSYFELKDFLQLREHPFVENDAGLTCDDLGLTSWRSTPDEEDNRDVGNRFDCLFIFRRGREEYMRALLKSLE